MREGEEQGCPRQREPECGGRARSWHRVNSLSTRGGAPSPRLPAAHRPHGAMAGASSSAAWWSPASRPRPATRWAELGRDSTGGAADGGRGMHGTRPCSSSARIPSSLSLPDRRPWRIHGGSGHGGSAPPLPSSLRRRAVAAWAQCRRAVRARARELGGARGPAPGATSSHREAPLLP